MGQGLRRPDVATPLPPPPAPPSRDANPWTMPSGRAPQRQPALRIDPARIPEHLKQAPAEGPRPRGRQTWLPFAIVGGVLLAVGGNAVESLRRGDYVGALVPLVFVGFIAVAVLRNVMRGRH